MRVVLVCPYLPHRRIGHGGGNATYQFARHLAARHDLCVLSFQRSDEDGLEADLGSQGVRMEQVSFRSERDRGISRAFLAIDRAVVGLRALLRGVPWNILKYDRGGMHKRLRGVIEEHKADVVIVEYTFMAHYARTAKEVFAASGSGGHVLLNTHEAGTLARLRRAVDAEGWMERRKRERSLMLWARTELAGLAWADTALCVTPQDRQFFYSLTGHSHLRLMPLGVAKDACLPVSHRRDRPPRLLFVGSFHHLPNRDALELLLESILPAVRERHPDVVLDVVGPNLPAELAEKANAAGDAVQVHGFVDDLEPFYDRAWLFVAPLFSGGGIKIKILEALARGCAVLTTPIGVEGIEISHAEEPRDAIVVEGPEAFAHAAGDLLEHPHVLSVLGKSGRDAVLARYEWSAIVDELTQFLTSRSG